ncbi:MAG: DUF4956 domain-containing protein [Microbacterium sp.]
MPNLSMILIDLAAIALLSLALYFPRHRRRDLVVAFVAVNIGVFAVASVLAQADVAMGLGLGLFGVLSIIRLRSSEISQVEVAYFFAALAIGLLGGLPTTFNLSASVLIAVIVAAMALIDHPALFRGYRQQTVNLDEAISDENELRRVLETRLGGTVRNVTVQHLDFVNDTTLVDVRYRVPSKQRASVSSSAARERVSA